MSKLKEKSNFNIDAAEFLLRENLYAPSVHCSYYSCFQLLKFTIKVFFGENYEKQYLNISSSQQNTHQYVINYVSNELKKFVDIREWRDFKNSIKDLKQLRIESDYENIEIGTDKGEAALKKAKEIRQYLITNFNV